MSGGGGGDSGGGGGCGGGEERFLTKDVKDCLWFGFVSDLVFMSFPLSVGWWVSWPHNQLISCTTTTTQTYAFRLTAESDTHRRQTMADPDIRL